MDRELGGVRHVDRHELYAALHQRCDESQVARQPIELGDDQLGLTLLAGRQGLRQFGPITVLTALDLGEFIDQRPPAAVQVGHDGFALCIETQAGFALPIRADAKIGNKLSVMRGYQSLPAKSEGEYTSVLIISSENLAGISQRFGCF